MSALTILPSLVLGMTSFTRIIIVMSILRQALGTQQTPPNQVLIAISLFLTFFIMAPTFNKVYDEAAVPYMNSEISAKITIDLVENLGSERIFHTRINNTEMRIKSFKNIKDKNITIYLPKNKLYLFDNDKNRIQT